MSEKILIIDDDLDTLRLVGMMLPKAGLPNYCRIQWAARSRSGSGRNSQPDFTGRDDAANGRVRSCPSSAHQSDRK
ncbi:MAG: hypothetical protein RBS68_15095, partial [Anaerolineales bacterium]|nr:hypothetical protein [Anaerolineales bacterium]